MWLTEMVEVDDARVEALTPEAFRLVLEARGWRPYEGGCWLAPSNCGVMCSFNEAWVARESGTFFHLGNIHHAGSTYDAFAEVERVQALLEAVEAAERGEWKRGAVWVERGNADAQITATGWVRLRMHHASDKVSRLWPIDRMLPDPDPARAAREARAQLPRLVRIICGVEG